MREKNDVSLFFCSTGQLITSFNWGPSQPSGGDQHCMYIVGGFLGYGLSSMPVAMATMGSDQALNMP